MRTASLLLTSAVLAACGSQSRQPAQDQPEKLTVGSGDTPLLQAVIAANARMHLRFEASHRMHHAIALSDLPRAQREARIIAELDEPDALPAWRPYVDEIRAAARDVMGAADPIAAARSTGTLGGSCARCHQAMRVKVKIALEPVPPDDPKLKAQMARHSWAAQEMWTGLVAASSEHWNEGARILQSAPLAITAEISEPPRDIGIADDVARIRLMATRAIETTDLAARGALYGELLGTCVRCHATIRDR